MVEIRVLGPIEVGGATDAVPLTAEKQRRLLAALVARAGEACSTDGLIDAVWGSSPPASADKLLQVYVSQLRRLLHPVSIRRRGASYTLELNGNFVDTVRFECLLSEGQAALDARNPALALSLLRRGLALWRGPAYGEFGYEEFARGEAERLEELRLAALEARFEAELALGRHADLVPELCALAAEHPLREPLQAQAMDDSQKRSTSTAPSTPVYVRNWGSSRASSCATCTGGSSSTIRSSRPRRPRTQRTPCRRHRTGSSVANGN